MTRAFAVVCRFVSGHLTILLAMLFVGFGTSFPCCFASAQTDDFPKAFNTDPPDSNPPSPEEMVKLIELPPGFNVTLFAGEPDVQQPICMDFDDKGRLWVAECYTYSGGPYETKLRDRVIILEDTDGDGKHDSRKVFWDKGYMLTSLTWGFGGLWVLHDGTLSFIPDKNGDDVPDSEPVVMLDGWSKDCGHNFVSGLIWGPDGWLYGRHGIVDTSYPGVPGTPKEERVFMNCGVWRYHPTKHTVEVVCNGTTNPWGLDYNEDGQWFMTNNVQGHLWHVIPGARYQRMYGQDFNPHAYELMDMTADHYHWDTKTKWNESRDGVANDLGGGHSHVGGLIYQGDNFPAEYRGKIFMCNTHGRRINVNRLDREGSGYVGRREPDFMIVKSPWFRGIDIKMGPEGAMYVSDWSDNGECHDHDGIHRTSGRIYRIAYGTPKIETDGSFRGYASEKTLNPGSGFRRLHLPKSTISRLAYQATDADVWVRRKSLRLLTEYTAEQRDDHLRLQLDAMKRRIEGDMEAQSSIHAANLLYVLDQLDQETAQNLLNSRFEIVRALAVKLITESETLSNVLQKPLLNLLKNEDSPYVWMAFASGLQRLPFLSSSNLGEDSLRMKIVSELVIDSRIGTQLGQDQQLKRMVWYGAEPLAARLIDGAVNAELREFSVRRISSGWEHREVRDLIGQRLRLYSASTNGKNAEVREKHKGIVLTYLNGVKSALKGRSRVETPSEWKETKDGLKKFDSKEIDDAVNSLSVIFGDGAAASELRTLAGDNSVEATNREEAIKALAQAKDADSLPMFFNLLGDRAVYGTVITALKSFDHPDTSKQLLNRMGGFKDGNRSLAIDTMSSREAWALDLMKAIEAGRFDARELTASQVRQLLAHGNEHIKTVLEAKWGVVQETPEARLASIEKWKHELTPENLAKADRENGAALFKKSCATCHKLFGEGKTIAPDLTGANRSNLDYLLMNIIDPSSVVPKQFTTSVIALKDGRVITGVIVSETDQSLVVQTDKEQLTLARGDVEEFKNNGKSLMPDSMLDPLTPEQVRDLFGFMMPQK